MKVLRTSPHNKSGTITNEHNNEIPREIYIFRRKIYDLRLM